MGVFSIFVRVGQVADALEYKCCEHYEVRALDFRALRARLHVWLECYNAISISGVITLTIITGGVSAQRQGVALRLQSKFPSDCLLVCVSYHE